MRHLGRPLPGVQHKYADTVLVFPAAGQPCHAYCSYCFRWPQFVGGVVDVSGEPAFVLNLIRAREPSWVNRSFLARYDRHATWLDELAPLDERWPGGIAVAGSDELPPEPAIA